MQVDADHPVERLLGGVEDVGPHRWRDAGIVDQQIDPPEAFVGLIHEPLPVGRDGDVGPRPRRPAAPAASSSATTSSAASALLA